MLTHDHTVFTYEPDGQARGLLIGSEIGEYGVVVEYLVVFPEAPPQTLPNMIRAGYAEAKAYGYRQAIVHVPEADPRGGALARLLTRHGFAMYADTSDGTWWNRWIA